MARIIIISFFVFSFECREESQPKPFDAFEFFIHNCQLAGFVNLTDSNGTKVDEPLFWFSSKSDTSQAFEFVHAFTCIGNSIGRYFVFKSHCSTIDSLSLQRPSLINPHLKSPGEKITDIPSRTWQANFLDNRKLYVVESRTFQPNLLIFFCNALKKIVASHSENEARKYLLKMKNDYVDYYFNQRLQGILKLPYHLPHHVKSCYNGKIIQFPGDACLHDDSVSFNNAIIAAKTEKGLPLTPTIDSSLLEAFSIPTDPIGIGLEKCKKELLLKNELNCTKKERLKMYHF